MFLTCFIATHASIITSIQSTSLYSLTSTRMERSPTKEDKSSFRSFGDKFEPRYILGAGSLDQ
jgi:hypothetical protein